MQERLARGLSPTECASELLNACLANDPREARGVGCDNMTAAIICFRRPQPGGGGAQQQQGAAAGAAADRQQQQQSRAQQAAVST